MKTIEYRNIDKSSWPVGPWSDEPDKKQWTDEATGLPCLIKRHPRYGILCGYVGVTEGHKYFGVKYSEADVGVHGGLTYSNFCQEDGDEETSICHIVEDGENGRVWWLGFDCGHAWDHQPNYNYHFEDQIYRDFDYVAAEIAQLAKQLA